jgi:hypothetical protein
MLMTEVTGVDAGADVVVAGAAAGAAVAVVEVVRLPWCERL